MGTRSCLAAFGLLLCLAGSARADTAPAVDFDRFGLDWPPRLRTVADDDGGGERDDLPPAEDGVLAGDAPAQQAIEADQRDRSVPSFRIELAGRMLSLLDSRFKMGPKDGGTSTVRFHRETRTPRTPVYGYRALVNVQFHRDWLIGGYLSQFFVNGPKREIHRNGFNVGGEYAPRGTRGRTDLAVSIGTLYFRYVVLDNDRVRLSYGAGVAVARFHFIYTGDGVRLNDRMDVVFAPTLDYMIQFRLFGPLYLYLESMFGVIAPTKLAAYISEFQAGFRMAVTSGFEVMIALNSSSGALEEYRDLWGGRRTSGHRYERAAWTSMGIEIGVAARF